MKRSPEDIAQWRAQMSEIATRVKTLDPAAREEMAARCGTLTAEGRPLSAFNCCYLMLQAGRPLAQVGGFRQWKKAGRSVRKGEHAIGRIWVPRGTGKAADGAEGPAEKTRFLLIPVFDIDQTEVAV